METPRKAAAVSSIQPQRKYTEEEKRQLLINLELEVQDRLRQFETYLAHSLEAFKLRHENEVTRIPRAVRGLTMGEFADKYDGDVNKALQAITRARLEASEDSFSLDDAVKKRKYDATEEPTETTEQNRLSKNARLKPSSPMKKDASGGAARSKLAKTPVSRLRQPPPSPGKRGTMFKSPHKAVLSNEIRHSPVHNTRAPSLSHFSPTLPETPAYPPGKADGGGGRLQRQRSIAILRGPSLAQPGSRQGTRTLEMILSLKVYMESGDILELDPLSTTMKDLDSLEGITEEARKSAKGELLELTGLMEKLGKWRI